MFGSSSNKNDPLKALEKGLAPARARRVGHVNRVEVAQAALPKAQADVKAKQDADAETLKAARTARRDLEDEIADMTAEIADDDAVIADIEKQIADIIKKRRQQERHDHILAHGPRTDEAKRRIVDALAFGVEVYQAAAVDSPDYGDLRAACRDFPEPFLRVNAHARQTLDFLAARALQEEPPPVTDKPVLTVVPKEPEPTPPVRVFSVQPVCFVAGAADPCDPARVVRTNRYQHFQCSEQQARIGYEHSWLLPEGHPSIEELQKHRATDQVPDLHLCHSLDEVSVADAIPIPEVLQKADFQVVKRGAPHHLAPPVEQHEPPQRVVAAGARHEPTLPPGFESLPRGAPYTKVIKPDRFDDDER